MFLKKFMVITTVVLTMSINAIHASNKNSFSLTLQRLEKQYQRRIGLYVYDSNSGQILAHRAQERFPYQSTFKYLVAAALLAKDQNYQMLNKKIKIKKADIIFWSPVSHHCIQQSCSLKTLSKAAVSYSDNAATNTIISQLGGLNTVQSYVRSKGNKHFTLRHFEAKLNSNPNNESDTTTPQDMTQSLQNLLLNDGLPKDKQILLKRWMQDNTTGNRRIRAGMPIGWSVADKTGSGSFGVANDVAMVWSPACKPILMTVFTQGKNRGDKPNDKVIASVAETVMNVLASSNSCFNFTQL